MKAGKYQIHFKKYSSSFDVFDFTARIYAPKNIKLVDDDDENLKKIKLSKEVIAKIPSIHDHIKEQDKKDEKAKAIKDKIIKDKKEKEGEEDTPKPAAAGAQQAGAPKAAKQPAGSTPPAGAATAPAQAGAPAPA